MGKRYLFLLRHAPYDGVFAREGLDMLLTTVAFDRKVGVLFLDDGVFQLLPGQHPEGIGRKSVGALVSALELYDVDDLWVEFESLQERGLSADRLIAPVRLLPRDAVAALLDEHDVLVNC